MEKDEFKKKFFEELQEDSEKGLIEWQVVFKNTPNGATKCFAGWRGADMLISFERDCSSYNRITGDGECETIIQCEIKSSSEILILKSREDQFTRKNLEKIVEKIPVWVEKRKSESILNILGLSSSWATGHVLHLEVLQRLDDLTNRGLKWQASENENGDGYSAEYRGVLIYLCGEGSLLCLSNSDFRWRINAFENDILDFYNSSDINRLNFYCSKCKGAIKKLKGKIYKISIIPLEEWSKEQKRTEETIGNEINAQEKRAAEKIGKDLFKK
jgi:hypothetical protein